MQLKQVMRLQHPLSVRYAHYSNGLTPLHSFFAKMSHFSHETGKNRLFSTKNKGLPLSKYFQKPLATHQIDHFEKVLMTDTLVFYHANCSDGFGAAFAAWLILGTTAKYVKAVS
jgi:hypothetical protein